MAVLGAGNGGLAFAGYLAAHDVSVALYNRSATAIAALRLDPRVALHNRLECSGTLDLVTDDLGDAIDGRGLILVTVPADAHTELLAALAPHLRPGQTVLLNPGGVGGWLVARHSAGLDDGVALAETSNLLFGCRKTDARSVDVSGVKGRVFLYGLPERQQVALTRLFPGFVPSPSPMETALNVHNVSLHCPVTATHLEAILAGRLARFYGDGLDDRALAAIEAEEEERAVLCRAYDVRCISLFELFHEVEADTLAELLSQRLGGSPIAAPADLDHRYFVEDIGFGLIPMIDLADLAGVAVPNLRRVLAALLRAHDWYAGARRLHADHLAAAEAA